MADSRPESADGHLTNRQIVLLGSAISARNMRKIATGYMDINKEVLRNIADQNIDDLEGFTRDVLVKWKNKPQNSGPEQVKKLASLLYQAADKDPSYVDPNEIQRILKVSRVTEKELNDLGDKLRPITEERSNINLIPWAEHDTVKMEDLYTELKIDKLENKPMGVQSTSVKDYKELFTQGTVGSVHRVKGKRVLGKGDPGSGKTTFAKKVAWDWAKGILTDFSLVFPVSLKLVSPGDSIENIIIEQNPELEGMNVTKQKLRDILETFGSHCFVILDGYDEHISGGNKPNEDVIKLLRGQNFLSCNVLLTSRPHSVSDIEQYFSTIVRIQGFTEKHAREFASRVLVDKEKIDAIKEIQCLNADEFIKEGNSVFTCPILLLFICVLVNWKEIDLARKEVTLGEIYTRLVRCLYRKYTTRNGKAFKQSEFVGVLKRVGFFAGKTLLNVRMGLQRSEVISHVGEDAFDYGLLIGHEDFRLSAEETSDIIISFPHRTIQEFLAALYVILVLDSGESTDKVPLEIPMRIPLLFHFLLWFLGNDCTAEYFPLKNKDKIYQQIETYNIKEINVTQFNTTKVGTLFPALNLRSAKRDELVERFMQKMLPKCKKIERLELDKRDPVGQIMTTFQPLLPQLSFILVSFKVDSQFQSCSEELHINIGPDALSRADELIAHCKGLDKPLSVSFILKEFNDLSKYLAADISTLNVIISTNRLIDNCLPGLYSIPYSPHLTSLFLVNQILDEDFALALSNVVEKGNLPNIRRLFFTRCNLKDKLSLLFQSNWPSLTHLHLDGSPLDESDIRVLRNIKVLLPNLTSLLLFLGEDYDYVTSRSFHVGNVKVRFPRHIALFDMFESPLTNITELVMNSMNKEEYKRLVYAINRGKLPKLRELVVFADLDKNQMVDINRDGVQFDVIKQGDTLDWLPPVNAPKLTHLSLMRFICTMQHLYMVTQSKVLTKLHKLDISCSSGMTGTLSILLIHSFPSLNSLILRICGLNSQDLFSLAQARAKGRLPELRHLDISRNDSIQGKLKDLFSLNARWENLCSLNASNDNIPIEAKSGFCIHKVPPSNKLVISESVHCLFQPGNRCWKNVQKIYVFCDTSDNQIKVLREILDALERGLLPALISVIKKTPADQDFKSILRTLLVKLLPNHVIEKVMKHAESLEQNFTHHLATVTLDEQQKIYSGEGTDSRETSYKIAIERVDMSSIVLLAYNEELTKSQTEVLIYAIRTCMLTIVIKAKLNEEILLQFCKYGVDYMIATVPGIPISLETEISEEKT